MPNPKPLLRADNLHKAYRKGGVQVPVLGGIDLEVQAGEFLSIVGQSGSGKSTLLHLLGTLDRPDRGEVSLDGQRIDNQPAGHRDRLRNRTFGFVFQFYHLLAELTVLENALVPEMINRSLFGWIGGSRNLRRRAAELLDRVGLGHRLHHRPRELSGGEMQRAAIVRAIIHRPRILLADEPTGNLDEASGREVLNVLGELRRSEQLTVILVTHNLEIVGEADRVVRLTAGRLERHPLSATASHAAGAA